MRIRSRRSFNGVLFGLVVVLVTLLVLGIVTGKIIFYILFGIIIFFSILGVIGLFTFLKKTGQESSSTRRSAYDISKGDSFVGRVGAGACNHEDTFIHDFDSDRHDALMFLWRERGRLSSRSTRHNALCPISNMEFDEVSHDLFIEFPIGEGSHYGD